jgi:hypothetical protein
MIISEASYSEVESCSKPTLSSGDLALKVFLSCVFLFFSFLYFFGLFLFFPFPVSVCSPFFLGSSGLFLLFKVLLT